MTEPSDRPMPNQNPPDANPPDANLPEPSVAQPRVRRRHFGASLIWLVPIIAALVGVSLVVNNWLQAGPNITITFQSADGLAAGKTSVKYKNVVIGTVKKIRLSGDRSHVVVNVALDKNADGFAVKDSRYWVVRPRIGLGGVSGVDTLLSGPFIGADVGQSKQPQKHFNGLELPPAVTHGAPGRSFTLHSSDLGSLDIGSPVYFRKIQVGRVASYALDKDGKGVTLKIFVDGPNDRFVTRSSRFWNASGLDVTVGANGLKVNTQSLATVIAGGVAFQDPRGPHDGNAAAEDADFKLFDNETTALAPPDGPAHYVRMRFDQSLRGLTVDAPVEFLGVNIGNVVSISMDYSAKTKKFSLVVGALIYPERLGKAYPKLVADGNPDDNETDIAQLVGTLVDRGLRAQARTGNLLTGQLYVELALLPNTPKLAFDMDAKPIEIPTVAGSFDKLQQQLGDIVEKINGIPFDSIGKNLDKTLTSLNGTLEQVNKGVLPQFKSTLKGIDKTLGTANSALSGDSPLQQSLGATLQELQRMARSLRVLSNYLGTHPESLIRGRKADQPLQQPVAPASRPSTKATGDSP